MEKAVEVLLDTMPKKQIEEGIDELFTSYFMNEEPTDELRSLVGSTVFALKKFLKLI